ncbi:MAG: AbrB/MazE/SpoVT family DNA-binding domain-containing protein [Terracidiphilus sp.]|jgi:AbrB family looped-hinge helix DNA binding protein
MELRARIQVGEKGRIVIPAEMREALGIKPGDSVDVIVRDHEVRISTRAARLKQAQERVRKLIPPGVSLADELIAERREEAKREQAGF